MKRWKESRGAGAAAKPLPVARIGLAATKGTPPPPEPPRAPAAAESGKGKHYRTLGLDFTGPDGKPATALGWVQNISDPTVGPFIVASPTPDAKPVTGEGPFRISVPDGTYSIAFTILTPIRAPTSAPTARSSSNRSSRSRATGTSRWTPGPRSRTG